MRRPHAAIALAAAAALLAGCSDVAGNGASAPTAGSGDGAGKAESLEVITAYAASDPGFKIVQSVAAQVQAANPNLKIKVVSGGERLPDAFETAFAAGREPDVAMVNLFDKTTSWISTGQAKPAGDYIDKWKLRDRIKPEAMKEWTDKNGTLQGFPYTGFVWPVWYNTELLAKAGVQEVPTTTDQLLEAAGKLKAAGVPGLVVGGTDWSGNKLFLQVAQSYLTEEQAVKVFAEGGYCASPEAMRGIELFVKLRDAGVFTKQSQGFSADQMNASFFGGEATVMPAGSWSFAQVPATMAGKIKLGGLPVPTDGVHKKPTAFQGYTSSGFWITRNGAKKEEAVRKFITAFYEAPVIERFVKEANNVPATLSEGPVKSDNPLMTTAVNDLDDKVDYVVLPDVHVPGPAVDPMTRVTALAYDKGDAQSICKNLDKVY